MTLATLNQYGITAFLLSVFVYFAVAYIKRRGESSDKRESTKDDHIASRGTTADKLIADQLGKATDFSFGYITRIEESVNEKIRRLEDRLDSKLDTILLKIGAMESRDAVFTSELKSWPILNKRVTLIQHDVSKNRDGINRALIKLGLRPIDQTPPFGIETEEDSIPRPIDAKHERDSGHIVSPHAAAMRSQTDKD